MAFRTTSWKQTEIGKIPSDWDVKTLGELSMYRNGKSFEDKVTEHGAYNLITLNSIDILGSLKKEHLKVDCFDNSLSKNDLIMILSDVAHGYLLGLTAVVPENNKYVLNQRVGALKNINNVSPEYLRLFINKNQKYFKVRGQGSSQLNLDKGSIVDFTVGYPKYPEQTAIAEVLSDLDGLIEGLEKLRDKKQLIKTGAMQELLTARRLPGFKNPWKESALEELGTFTGSGVDKTKNNDEIPVKLLNYMDVYKRDFIYSDELQHWVTAPNDKLEKCAIKQGDVFFTPSSETPFDIALSAVAMEDIPNAVYSYHTNRLRIHKDWDLKFKTYIFKTRFFLGQAETMCEGSGTRYVITLPKFRSLKVKYPTDKEEQAAIGNILYDIDAEIDAITKKINKYRAIKDGAAAELLSGRIRLIKPKAEV